MAGDLQGQTDRANSLSGRFERAKASYMTTMQKSIDRRDQKRREAEEAARKAALEQQKIDAQLQRDKQQQKYEQTNAAQRAWNASGAAAEDFNYTSKLNQQQQKGVLKRDDLQNRFDTASAKQQAIEQARRDRRLNEFDVQGEATQFQNTLQRDAVQQGYTLDRDNRQQGNTLQRDAIQFGFDTQRAGQQQRHTLERDYFQSGIQADRDQRLNEFDVQGDDRQFQNQMARDQVQQQYSSASLYQREAADIAAKWQDQVAQARNGGLDFSARQRKEMQDLDTSFRKNVLNGYLSEDLKHQAMVQHQKKLAAIIPEEKVANPDEEIEQQFRPHPTLGMLKRGRDSQGNADWMPLGTGQGEDKQAQAQQKQAEQQAAMKRDAASERLTEFQKVVDKLWAKEAPGDLGGPLYKSREEVIKAAMEEFEPREQFYRDPEGYGLQPLWAFQAEADKVRAEQEGARWQGPQRPGNGNPYRQQPAQGGAPAMNPPAAQTPPPVMSVTSPLPKQVVEQLRAMPGGNELVQIRERHKSKTLNDQSLRMAATIVANAMLTGDTSDPHLANAQDMLKRAGYKVGN